MTASENPEKTYDVTNELKRLSQSDFFQEMNRRYSPTELVDVWRSVREDERDYTVFAALIPGGKADEVLKRPMWDLSIGDGHPGACVWGSGDEREAEYFRYGNNSSCEPLIIHRDFHGAFDPYNEINEEFRLFHRLFHDKKENRYYRVQDSGEIDLVAIFEPDRIRIRLKEIRQFCAIKEMYLSLQFDMREHSRLTLEQLGKPDGGPDRRNDRMCWALNYGDFSGVGGIHKSFSRFIGKRLIEPLPKAKSGLWGFDEGEPEQYEAFIIGETDEGNPITAHHDRGIEGAGEKHNGKHPDYLTPVSFKKQVLDKYYAEPTKYSVSGSVLTCAALWSMYVDNHHEDIVIAWIGDLWRDLPYVEQRHWRNYNFPRTRAISDTFARQQLDAEFVESDRPEFRFQSAYRELRDVSADVLGWHFLRPLVPNDTHYLYSIRVPSVNEQKDFDELILALAKVIVDSLNEEEIKKYIEPAVAKGLRGSIAILENALKELGLGEFEEHVKFLRNLQNLRSTGSAHRKGSNYERIAKEFDVDNRSLKQVFEGILTKAVGVLAFLKQVIERGDFEVKP